MITETELIPGPGQSQTPILEEVAQEFGDKVDVNYVCVSPKEDCESAPDAAKYMPYEEGLQLYDSYKLSGEGVPAIVVNCAYKRIGSYGAFDPDTEKSDETKLINLFLEN